MLMPLFKLVKGAKGQETSQEEVKCLCKTFLRWNYLMFRGLISWGHSPTSFSNKYILLAIDYVSNGLKQ